MSDSAVESLLRPPVEFNSAGIAAFCAVIAMVAPWVLMMPRQLGWITAAVLVLFAGYRFKQGWRIVRYQRNLLRLPKFVLSATQIPVSPQAQFLGRGFAWGQLHTQRLHDTADPGVQIFLMPNMFFRFARWAETKAIVDVRFAWLVKYTQLDSPWNPARPLPDVGGSTYLHGVSETEDNIYQKMGDRVGHTLIIATTRQGKTRLLEVLASQDIARGECTIILDPKRDKDLFLRAYNEAKRHNRPFYSLDLANPELSSRYNFAGAFSKTTEIATRTTDPLPDGGNSAAFKQFAWKITHTVGRALHAIGDRPSPALIMKYVYDIDSLFARYAKHLLDVRGVAEWKDHVAIHVKHLERNPKEIPRTFTGRDLEAVALFQYTQERKLGDSDATLESLNAAFAYEKSFYDKIFSSLGPFLEKITTGAVGKLLSPDYFDLDDKRPIIDWLTVIRTGAVVYFGFDALTDSEVAGAAANAALSDLAAVGGFIYKFGVDDGLSSERDKNAPVNLYADELEAIVGKNFIPMVNRLGGANFRITALTQSGFDLENKLGSAAAAKVVIDNFNTLIMFRVRSVDTAKMLTEQLKDVRVTTMTADSGTSQSNANGTSSQTAINKDRVSSEAAATLEPNDVMSLPKGQAFAFTDGGKLYKIRIPLLDPVDDAGLPQNIKDVAADMKKKYYAGENEKWWLAAGAPIMQFDAAGKPSLSSDGVENNSEAALSADDLSEISR